MMHNFYIALRERRIVMTLSVMLALAGILVGCQQEPEYQNWELDQSILLDGVKPIGITKTSEGYWLSDGDHNRMVLVDAEGNILKTVPDFDRPMHIDSEDGLVYVPEYGRDGVRIFGESQNEFLRVSDSLDAPAGVAVRGEEIAIADFYNHRILHRLNGKWSSYGTEGKGVGQFYYPTDVDLTGTEIYVADAYNNRIQVLDKQGLFQRKMADTLGTNAATGLEVSEKQVFLTDFENDRVLVIDTDGLLLQEITDSIQKPTDVLLDGDHLFIINYRSSRLNRYVKTTR